MWSGWGSGLARAGGCRSPDPSCVPSLQGGESRAAARFPGGGAGLGGGNSKAPPGGALRCPQTWPHSLTRPPHLPQPTASPNPAPSRPQPSGQRVALPSSAPSGPGPGAVGTGQAGRAVPRGGGGAAGAGRTPAPPAGGTATLPGAAAGSRGLQGPAGGEGGDGAAGGGAWGARPTGDRVGLERSEFGPKDRSGLMEGIVTARRTRSGGVWGQALWRMGQMEGRGGGCR